MMTLRLKHILVWTAALVLVLTCRAFPVGADTSASGRLVLDLINAYREAPYDHAEALGYDPGHLAKIGILPDTVFPPYQLDESLVLEAAAANQHAAIPDHGENPDPVRYDRHHVVQTGAMLTFFNFIPGETAATLFAENLLKNELSTGEFEFVFASGFSHAGASVDPGVQDGRNAWFSTLMLGTSARVTDMQMLNLINQVRAEPWLIDNYLTEGLNTVLLQNQQIYLLPSLHFRPVFFDGLLYDMAKADVLNPEAVTTGPDGRMVLNTEAGENVWPGEWFATVTAAASWENMVDARPVTDLFTGLLYHEFTTWPYNAVIFSNHYSEAGAFVSLDTDESADSGSGAVTVCAGAAVPVLPGEPAETPVPETVRIYGLLFLDLDDSGFYSPGEELAGEIVDVYPFPGDHAEAVDSAFEPAYQVVTDNAGHFSLSLAPGRQWVFETWKDDQVSRRIIHIDTDRFVKMRFFPPDQN